MICLLVRTDGRKSCISRTIPSALENLRGPITEYLICDDSADPGYQSWLSRMFHQFDVIGSNERLGFGGNIRRAWNHITTHSQAHYIFDLEDDFTFNRPVDLYPMLGILDRHQYLVQLALRRQPWNEDERKAGGVVEQHPTAYEDRKDIWGNEWLEHRLFLTTNPSLYRYSLCQQEWPDVKHSEGMFTHQLLREGLPGVTGDGVRFGFMGARDEQPWVEHIGTERVGNGY